MSTVADRIAAASTSVETNLRAAEFVQCVKFILLGGHVSAERLATKAGASARVVEAVRAATDPMTLSSVGGQLSAFQILAQSFLASLASATAFDAMLPAMMNLPLRTRIIAATSTVTGVTLAERDIKRVSSMALAASDLDVSKAGAVIAVSQEVLRAGGDGTARFLENQLRVGVAAATDAQFIALISVGATSIPSSGGNASGARLDLRALLQAITIGSGSRLFLVVHPDIAAAWSVLGDSSGGPVFPGAVYNGGLVGGVRVIASDSCPSGEIILADASQIAAGQDNLRIDTSKETSLQMDSSPDSPPTSSTNMLSLWQTNTVGVLVERFFGAKVVGSNAVAIITGANYTGGSPS